VDAQAWTTLSQLLDEALDLPADARVTWLDGLGAEYEAFKPRLRAMLEEAAATGDAAFLATLPRLRALALDEGDERAGADGRAGAMVGPYRLVRRLASGGQGAVWLAERPDGLVNRPVAIKLPVGLVHRRDLAERMARERDILASLTHPHIARLYDAGVSADGEPFLALEYVEGAPIDRDADDRGLDVERRVRLFLQVVRAVAYAHGQLVIHRDLKPSNVLVTREGYVRLLDFGIAKLLDEGAPRDVTATAAGGRVMTLAYASPEQVSHAPLGVATDVYSLGVMLYELLCGARPCAPARDTAAALEDAILHDEPRRPSDAAVDAARRRALRGDLDTILLKALKKAPADRYATAGELGDDLERYLTGRPVLAQPDSRWYRARKFLQRNRAAAVASAAVLVAVLAGAGVAAWQARVARAEQRRAEEVKTFIASMLQDSNLDAQGAEQASVLDLLKRATERLTTLPRGAVKAELLVLLGEGLLSRGDTDTLEAVARQAVAEGAALGADHDLLYRARVLMAYVHMYRGRPDEMRAELDAIAPRFERQPGDFARELALVWRLRADAAIDAGDYAEAQLAAREAVVRAEAGMGPRSAETLHALGVLVDASRATGNRDEALSAAGRGTNLARELYGENDRHPSAIRARAQYARALGDTGRIVDAIGELEHVLDAAVAVFGTDGRTVAFHLQNLTNFQIRAGRIDAAITSARRGLAIIVQHAEPESPTVAAFQNSLGNALLAARRGTDALEPLGAALAVATRAFGPAHRNTLNVRANHALAQHLAGRETEARRAIDAVLSDMRQAGTSLNHPLRIAGRLNLAAGDLDGAEGLLAEAEQVSRDTDELAYLKSDRGLLSLARGRHAEAATLLAEGLATLDEMAIDGTPAKAEILVALGRAELELGKPADALPRFEAADRFWQTFDPGHPDAREAARWLARCRQLSAVSGRPSAVSREPTAESQQPKAHSPQPIAHSPCVAPFSTHTGTTAKRSSAPTPATATTSPSSSPG
jgi:serine/threonine-protein kinase